MRNSELIIEPPVTGYERSETEITKWASKYRALPGRVIVLMDPTRDTFGDLVLPDTVNDKIRPESGTVIASSPGKVKPGVRVIVRPYAGLWVEEDGDQVRMFNEPADDLVATVNPKTNTLHPLGNWVEIVREGNETSFEVSELGKRGWRHTAQVTKAGPNVWVNPNDRVVLTSDENAFFRVRWQDENRCFVREVNADGVRQVWAVIE